MNQAAQNRLFGLVSQSSCLQSQIVNVTSSCVGAKSAEDPAAPPIPTVQADGKVGEKVYFHTDDPEKTTPW